MGLKQRISISVKTVQAKIVVRDDTGIVSYANPEGYGQDPSNKVGSILSYMFIVKNLLDNSTTTSLFGEGHLPYPLPENIASHHEVDLKPQGGTFDDGVYLVNMITIMKTPFQGSGVSGTNVLVDVPGFSLLSKYDGIIDNHGNVYRIVHIQADAKVIVLDKDITSEFTEFLPVFIASSEKFILSEGLEDCLTINILKEIRKNVCDEKTNFYLSQLRLIYWGIQLATKRGDYNSAVDLIRKGKEYCNFLNCGC